MNTKIELWNPVKGLEGQYEVSSHGRIRSFVKQTAKILKGGITKNGYHIVDLAGRMRYVHRIVLEAFVGECPSRHEACHDNGIKHDNRLANLRWDTRPENNADRVRHGTSNRGERCGTAKLTENQAREILNSTKSSKELARRFGVAYQTIDKIRCGSRWGHLKQVLEAVK
jgi:hypothetical protein